MTITDYEKYVGMTRTTVHARMQSHLKDQRAKLQKSPMYRHDLALHNGQHQEYEAEIIDRERRIVRLNCLEALHIEKIPHLESMNARQEGGRGGVVRIRATRTV